MEPAGKRRNKIIIWSAAGAVLLAVLIAVIVILCRPEGEVYEQVVTPQTDQPFSDTSADEKTSGQSGASAPAQSGSVSDGKTDADPKYPEVTFPVQLISGRLEISSVFQFTGVNPDCGGETGSNIAAIQVRNISGRHLTEARITLTLTDRSRVEFRVKDLPDGESAMIFSPENISMNSHSVFMKAHSKAEFAEEPPLEAERVQTQVNGRMVTVTNQTDRPLKNVTVYCHCVLGGDCFGGLTYAYRIAEIPARGSRTVDAADCFQGKPEVVRIQID